MVVGAEHKGMPLRRFITGKIVLLMFLRCLAFMTRREISVRIHIVQKGDTLWKIAKKYGVNFEELKKMNTQLSNPDMIMPGMKIKIPGTGGNIKKEAPVGSKPGATIKMGAKKEKPITMPITEAPKEVPIKEAPVAEKPVQPQVPIEVPKEVPTKPFIPKMPKPIMPEIDINNYYMMNMANLSVQQPKPIQQPIAKPIEHKPIKQPIAKPIEHKPIQQPIAKPIEHKPIQQPIAKPIEHKPIPQPIAKPIEHKPIAMPIQQPLIKQPILQPIQQSMPQLPPKPVNILPPVKPMSVQNLNLVESESSSHTHKGGYNQPMFPNQHFYPVSPIAPGAGFYGGYPQQMAYPQVQGVASMPMYPSGVMPMHQMPHHGMAGVESHGYVESSSWHMPKHQMPHTNPVYTQPTQAQMPAPVMGVEEMGQHQLPLQPTYTAPAMQPAYGYPEAFCPPYPEHLIPISPVMPGSGFCGPVPMPYGYPQMGVMPQVQGVMEEYPEMAQMPLMPTQSQMPLSPTQSQMPIMPTQSQMPIMPTQSQMPLSPAESFPKHVKGIGADCGCDGAQYGMGGFPGAYGMGGVPMYRDPYGQQMGYPTSPYMNPYGYAPMGGTTFGMPRSFEESSEFDV